MKGGRSPTEVANLANGAAPQRGALAGGRGRPDRKRFFTPMRNHSLPGRHITDCQMRLYMSFRQTETASVSAAKAGFSTSSAYRMEQDLRLPSQKRSPRGRRRRDPLAAVWDSEVVPLLKSVPGLRPFSYVSRERRVLMDHPLRAIRKIVNAALTALSPEFEKLYARSGRPSIAPEKLTPSGEGPTVRIRFAPPASPFQNSPATSLGQQN